MPEGQSSIFIQAMGRGAKEDGNFQWSDKIGE
jgi:hypothetical protein